MRHGIKYRRANTENDCSRTSPCAYRCESAACLSSAEAAGSPDMLLPLRACSQAVINVVLAMTAQTPSTSRSFKSRLSDTLEVVPSGPRQNCGGRRVLSRGPLLAAPGARPAPFALPPEPLRACSAVALPAILTASWACDRLGIIPRSLGPSPSKRRMA